MLHHKSVLVVDDSHIIQQTTKAILLKSGFSSANIYTVGNAKEALLTCQTTAIDILLLDFNLGQGRSGLQLLEQLHALELLAHQPLVLIITADDSLPIVMAFAEFEPDDYLIKPLRPDVLQKRLAVNFAQQQLRKSVWQAYCQQGTSGARTALQQAKNEKSFRLAITQLCRRLALHGQHNAACALLSHFTRQHDYLPAKLLHAELLVQGNQLAQARQILGPLHTAYPKHIKVLDTTARLYLAENATEPGYQAWLQAHQLSPYNIERMFGLLLMDLLALSNGCYTGKVLRDGCQMLPDTIWDNRDRRALLVWGVLQQPSKKIRSLKELWCRISRESNLTAADRPYLQLLNAWQHSRLGHTLLAFKQLNTLAANQHTHYSFIFQLILLTTYQQLGMQSAVGKTLRRLAMLCTQESCTSHRQIKYQWLMQFHRSRCHDHTYQPALALFERSPHSAGPTLLEAWQSNRFDPLLAYSLVTLYCNDQIDMTLHARKSILEARWVFESLPQPPHWYRQLVQANSALQTPVQTMTAKAKGAVTA